MEDCMLDFLRSSREEWVGEVLIELLPLSMLPRGDDIKLDRELDRELLDIRSDFELEFDRDVEVLLLLPAWGVEDLEAVVAFVFDFPELTAVVGLFWVPFGPLTLRP